MIEYIQPAKIYSFSALQRAEIAEMFLIRRIFDKLRGFSALQRAEIAEIQRPQSEKPQSIWFQCSSTSRNC